MTIQSLAWAMDQSLPDKAKLVLQAMANHADHTNGYVHFDAATIAREASIQVPSLWRYLGALERNGYLAHDKRKASDGEKRDYWLALDRDPGLPWAWSAQDGAQADEDTAADGPDRPPEGSKQTSVVPSTFKRVDQDAQRKVLTAPPPDQPPDKPFFVIEGSRAFEAWCAHCRTRREVTPFSMTRIVDGQERRGFWRPSLFPPAERVEVDRVVE